MDEIKLYDMKFFTNEPENDLYSRFNKILKDNTQFFDIIVGYFRTSGFFRLYSAMEDIERIRILVGLNVDRHAVDIINSANGDLTVKEATEHFVNKVKKEFEDCPTSSEIEKGVYNFIDWLKSGKIEMRMYIDAPLHAKVYIMRKDSGYTGSVITGSSNFSEAGLINNLEFNVELKDTYDVQFALDRFEKLWQYGVPIEESYIESVENKTWLRNDITPYEIYLKTLYEFFSEEINADKDVSMNNLLPPGYMTLRYQLDAVVQAKKTLEAYNGVFISDVVGLGKTYICTMLAKCLGKSRKLIICPPVLVNYWEEVLFDFDVSAKVISLGKLDDIIKGSKNFDYIFIDEAHRFRNSGTDTFSKLHSICYGKKIVLISATPINNYASDIENQIYLFQPKHNSNIVGVKNLEGFFASLKGKLKGLKPGTSDYMEQMRSNSNEIRDKLLRNIMIRRTRSEIMQYYEEDLKQQGLTFPKLDAPEKIEYVFDDVTDGIFNETIKAIKDFSYARYKPLTYLKNTKMYATMLTAQHNMGGFMKGILIKRLESSFYAFRMTLSRFIDSYERFINMYKQTGEVWISKKVDVYELIDSGDIESLMKMVENEDGYHFNKEDFKREFIIDLNKDLSKLKYLQQLWDSIDTDPKLETFMSELEHNRKLVNSKIIIFTESKETAEYLLKNLKKLYGERAVAFSGMSSMRLKSDIEDSFNPKNIGKGNDKYDLLITTDILAEGINLHRSNCLVNYDLPWNPTKVMQRVGRINRVGTEHQQIYVFNFFPTAQSSKHLPLKDRILEKIQIFHDTLGEDYKYISDEEIVSPQKLFDELTSKISEEDGSNPELAYLAEIRKIRDNDKALFEKIKRLPKKSKTGRYSDMVNNHSTLTFIRKGALKEFYITDEETKQLSFIDAVHYLECEPTEKRINVGNTYYEQVDLNSKAFDESLVQEEVAEIGKAQLLGNDSKVVKILKILQNEPTLIEEQENTVARLIKAYENGDIPQNITKKIVKELKTVQNDMLELYSIIISNIPENYLFERQNVFLQIEGEKQVILSCYMKESKP